MKKFTTAALSLCLALGVASVYAADTMSNDSANPLDDRTVHIDQYTGRILADVGFGDYGAAGKAMAAGIAFHEGDMGLWNLVLVNLVCLSIIFLSVSGFVMWWKRRPPNLAKGRLGAPEAPPGPRVRERIGTLPESNRLHTLPRTLKEYELITSGHESRRSPRLPEAMDHEPRLLHAARHAHEIAVGRDEAKAIHMTGMQHVHGVDDQRCVGGVFAAGVAELLYGLDSHFVQHLFPAFEVGGCPVAIGALDRGGAVARHFGQQLLDDGRLRVVRIDQNRDSQCLGLSQNRLPVRTKSGVLAR
mgnify:CR=1 FL=1